MPDDSPLIEPVHCPDVFVSGLARIERLSGGMVRMVFYAEETGIDGRIERHVVCKMVRHMSTLGTSITTIIEAMNDFVAIPPKARN